MIHFDFGIWSTKNTHNSDIPIAFSSFSDHKTIRVKYLFELPPKLSGQHLPLLTANLCRSQTFLKFTKKHVVV